MPDSGAAVLLFNRPLGTAVDMKIAFKDVPGLNGKLVFSYSVTPGGQPGRFICPKAPSLFLACLLLSGKDKGCTVRNIWEQTTTKADDSFTVKSIAPHSGAFLRISSCQ